MRYFPAFFDLRGQPVLVVGGGEVALRKVDLLLRCAARVTLVAPEILPELRERALTLALHLEAREFAPEDLDGKRLVIVATSKRALNRWIAKLSESRGLPVNVVDDRDASGFIVPAIVDRDPVIVAVSSGGTAPVLARRLRERLEALVPTGFGNFALWLARLRSTSMDRLRGTRERRKFFEALIDGPAARHYLAGDQRGAALIAQRLLATTATSPRSVGEVTLVGAGPGDPELLTLKALRTLQDADVILHDRLVSPGILDLARRDATLISVGKAPGGGGIGQSEINALMIEHVLQGKSVVRLKGGDPFIFGRGGEELDALTRSGVRFSVVPGITAALGVAAYSGIPLTHRDHAHSVTLVTGHADGSGAEPDWAALAATRSTVVFYMGLGRLGHIAQRLLAHGAPPDLPAALISQGTLAQQRVVTASVSTIVEAAAAILLESPTLLVIGRVVALRERFDWFNVDGTVDNVPRSA